jgi:hypothetical protein
MWKIPIKNNTTNLFSKPWNDIKSRDLDYLKKTYYTNNYAIMTGKENGITVLDLDFHKDKEKINTDSPLYKEWIEKFGEYPEFDTYTVKSKSGGRHYYFLYDEEILQTQSDIAIDIRNDGGIIFGSGNSVGYGSNKKIYETIKDVPFTKCPDDVKEFILRLKKEEPKQQKKKKIKEYKEIDNESLYKYTIPKWKLKQVFDKLPPDYWFTVTSSNGKPSFLIWTTACKILDVKDLWDEYNQKYPNYDKKKNECIWNSAKTNIDCVTNILKHSKLPYALKLIDYHKYQPILQNKIEPDILFDSNNNIGEEKGKIGKNYFQKNINYIMKSDTGTGKTTSFQKYIERTNQKFISITMRVTLADDQYKRFSSSIDEVVYYKNLTSSDKINQLYNNKTKQLTKSLVIEVESICHRFPDADKIDLSDVVIYLDEFNSLIQTLHTSDTLKNNCALIYDQLIVMLKKCKQIIMTDADISDTSILWFKENIGRDFEFHKNEYKHNKNVKTTELLNYEDLVDKLYKTEKWLVPCDSYRTAKKLEEKFPDAICITKDTNEIPNLDDADRVIYSPKILNGVDSVMERPVFCVFEEQTVNPAQMVQMMCRCRNITHLFYIFFRKEFKPKNIDKDSVYNLIQNKHYISLNFFSNRFFRDLEKGYLNTLFRITYDELCYRSNPYAHFKKLIKQRGIIDEDKYFCTSSASLQQEKKDLAERIEQKKILEFDIDNYSSINEILKVPKEYAKEYVEYFIDEKKLGHHYSVSTFFFQKNVNSVFDKFDNKSTNFAINKLCKRKTKLKFLQDIKKASGCNDPYNIEPTKIIDNEKVINHYITIFRKRGKKFRFDTIYEVQKNIVSMYKNLFGNDIIQSISSKSKKKGCKNEYKINEKFIEKDKTLFTFREKISKNVIKAPTINIDNNYESSNLDVIIINNNSLTKDIPKNYEWIEKNGIFGYFPM